jgi:hypothetical protein
MQVDVVDVELIYGDRGQSHYVLKFVIGLIVLYWIYHILY